jgi:LacI family transcriptional regulator
MTKKTPTSKVTIVEVAKRAKVSLGTVSRVMNNNAHVSPETRERVSSIIQDMGYIANRQARSLKGMKTDVIGVLVPDLATSYIGEILHGIDSELALNQFELMLFTTHRAAIKEANYVANMVQGMVDGLLLVLPRTPSNYIGSLEKSKFPYVLIDHQGMGNPCAAVGSTNWQGGYNATEYLVKLGHKRIGFITGSMDLRCSEDRLKGYRSALRTHHIPEDETLIYEGDFLQMNGYTGASALLNLPEAPTAIFASNDVMAMGVMDAVRDRNLRIPDDVSVIGFDNIHQSALVYPPLTTVHQPLEQMGRVATQMLLNMLKNPKNDVGRIELPTELIIRSSTSTPKDRAG